MIIKTEKKKSTPQTSQIIAEKPALDVKKQKPDKAVKDDFPKPARKEPKVLITLRLKPAVLAHFKSLGKGWQSKIDEILEREISK